jgi:hypothetical protein
MEEKYDYYSINGTFEIPHNLGFTLDKLDDLFIQWVEDNKIYFGGVIGEVNEQGERI